MCTFGYEGEREGKYVKEDIIWKTYIILINRFFHRLHKVPTLVTLIDKNFDNIRRLIISIKKQTNKQNLTLCLSCFNHHFMKLLVHFVFWYGGVERF